MNRIMIILLLFPVSLPAFSQQEVNSLLRARIFLDRGLYEEAVSVVEGSVDYPNDYRCNLLLGDILLSSGDYSGAVGSYNTANYLKQGSGELGLARVYAAMNDRTTWTRAADGMLWGQVSAVQLCTSHVLGDFSTTCVRPTF